LLDSAVGGDEPYMLASNLPGVCVLVDRNRVKAGRWAVKRFGCDTLILDDGFQYQRLKHSLEVVLVDKTNPFGNGHMLPRGVLREPARHIERADVIFLTKSDGDSAEVIEEIREYNSKAEIIECRHAPRILKDVWSREELPLEWLKGKTLTTLSGIAVPQGFEDSLRKLGARVIWCERYADHHRYDSSEIIYALNKTADLGADALVAMHSHCMQGYETYRGCPILYGLGNWYFPSRFGHAADSPWYSGYLAHLTFEKGKPVTYTVTPYHLVEDSTRFEVPTGEKREAILRYLDRISAPLFDEEWLWRLHYGWCLKSGKEYAKALRYDPAFAEAPLGEEDASRLAALKNLFGCEAHNALIRNLLFMEHEGKCAEHEKDLEELLSLCPVPRS
jgi:hypothetical protein